MCKHIYNPDQTYQKGTPFTYLISWSELNISYYGVRYKKTCHPDDLWKKYFTSSTPLKEFRTLNGEPDIIKIDFTYDTKEEAISSEYHYIKENKLVQDPNWLNLGNGGEEFYCKGDCGTKESHQKQADSIRGRIWINNGIEQKLIKPEFFQEHLNLEWKKGRLPISKESHQKQADSVRGRIWINNDIDQKQIKKEELQLFPGWKLGQLPRTHEQKEKIAENVRGCVWINNGVEHKRIKKEFLQEHLDLGWESGQLPRTPEQRAYMTNIQKGTFFISNGLIQLKVFPEEAEILYSFGFLKESLFRFLK